MSVIKRHFSSKKNTGIITSGGNRASVSLMSKRISGYTDPTVTTTAAIPRVYSGTYTQINSVLNISFTATYAVTATDYYFSGTDTDITVRYVGLGGYDSIQNATTATAGLAPTPGTYIYVTNTGTVISDYVNSADVNLVFALSTVTSSVTATVASANLNMYGSRPITLNNSAPLYNTGTFRNFIDLTDPLRIATAIDINTTATIFSSINANSGCGPMKIFSAGANDYDSTARFYVTATNAQSPAPFSNFIVAGPGTVAKATGYSFTATMSVAVNIWTGTAYRSLLGDSGSITMTSSAGQDWFINANTGSTVTFTGSSNEDKVLIAGPRYSTPCSGWTIWSDRGTGDTFTANFFHRSDTGTPLASTTAFANAGGGSSMNVSGSTLVFSTTTVVLSTSLTTSTGVTSVTTGGGANVRILISNATLTAAAAAYNAGAKYTTINGYDDWRDMIGNLDIYNTLTVVIKGFDPIYATGGTITTNNGYRYHIFTATNTFSPTTGWPSGKTIEALVVAGGGGGSSGGGGAGGSISTTTVVVASTNYTVTIGAGGTGDYTTPTNGVDTSLIGGAISITATGGGAGGNYSASSGASGGSGGGGGHDDSATNPATSGGSGITGQGFAGAGSSGQKTSSAAGGGGGSSGPGGSLYGSDGGTGTIYTQLVTLSSTSITTANYTRFTFTVASGLYFQENQAVYIRRTSDATVFMWGPIYSYSGTTLTFDCIGYSGAAGPFTDWSIYYAMGGGGSGFQDSTVFHGGLGGGGGYNNQYVSSTPILAPGSPNSGGGGGGSVDTNGGSGVVVIRYSI